MNEASRDGTGLARGTPGARRALVALFAAGFATFSSLYSVQALMPLFSQTFGVSPAESSLSLSLTTGVLALTLFVAGLMSEAIDRKRMMAASLLISAGLSIAAAFSPGWHALLAARALEGIALGGVPALAMAYLSEEMRAGDLGFAMGLYIGGSAFGGMSGRVLAGVVADIGGWRASMAVIGGLGLFCAAVFILLLPPSRHFRARRGLALSEHFEPIARHLRHPALPWLFACGFILMGAFVTVYNYIGYRLAAPPFGLSQSAIGAIFVVYLLGIAASALFGRLADRYGRAPVPVAALSVMSLGLLLMLPGRCRSSWWGSPGHRGLFRRPPVASASRSARGLQGQPPGCTCWPITWGRASSARSAAWSGRATAGPAWRPWSARSRRWACWRPSASRFGRDAAETRRFRYRTACGRAETRSDR